MTVCQARVTQILVSLIFLQKSLERVCVLGVAMAQVVVRKCREVKRGSVGGTGSVARSPARLPLAKSRAFGRLRCSALFCHPLVNV
jgi:hypothetical protein